MLLKNIRHIKIKSFFLLQLRGDKIATKKHHKKDRVFPTWVQQNGPPPYTVYI